MVRMVALFFPLPFEKHFNERNGSGLIVPPSPHSAARTLPAAIAESVEIVQFAVFQNPITHVVLNGLVPIVVVVVPVPTVVPEILDLRACGDVLRLEQH